ARGKDTGLARSTCRRRHFSRPTTSMSNDKLRRQIAYEAARMLVTRQESDYYRAKLKAGRRVCQGWARPADLPTDQDIRDEVQSLARMQDVSGSNSNGHAAHEADNGWETPNGLETDRFQVYRRLLAPLETVKLNPLYHPEGDALYHSLQVFELARD